VAWVWPGTRGEAGVRRGGGRVTLDGSLRRRERCVPENFLRDGSIPCFAALVTLAASECLAGYSAYDDRVGVLVGTGMGGSAADFFRAASLLLLRRVSPHFVPHVLPSCAASFVARTFGLRMTCTEGPSRWQTAMTQWLLAGPMPSSRGGS